jgi:hypothetical protein
MKAYGLAGAILALLPLRSEWGAAPLFLWIGLSSGKQRSVASGGSGGSDGRV